MTYCFAESEHLGYLLVTCKAHECGVRNDTLLPDKTVHRYTTVRMEVATLADDVLDSLRKTIEPTDPRLGNRPGVLIANMTYVIALDQRQWELLRGIP